MLTQTEAYGSYQTRRFACDRCHKHKLRCERAPILADGNIVMLSIGSCKRCEKAGAECRTTNTATSVGNASSNDRPGKRKSSLIEVEDAERDPASHSSSLNSTTENELAIFSHSPFTHPPGELMFNTDGGEMLDLRALETEVDDFYTLETLPTPATSSVHFHYPGSTICQPESHEGSAKSNIDAAYEAPLSPISGSTSRTHGANATPLSVHSCSNSHDNSNERKRLLDLHTLVFDGLHRITEGDLVNSLLASNSMTPAGRNGDTPPSDIVSRVLVTSERLIELLDIFDEKLSSEPSRRPHGNFSSQRTLLSIVPTQYRSSSPSQPNNSYLRRQLYSLPENVLERRAECTVSLPIVLSFLTCYVGLLSVYRTVFSHIQEMLRTAENPALGPMGSAPQSKWAPLSQVESNTLNHEKILRIRIQLEVMTHMLDRIRRAWAGFKTDNPRGNEDSVDGSCSFNKTAALSLLQSMLMHEGFDCRGEDFKIGLSSLDLKLDGIRRMLRGERCSR